MLQNTDDDAADGHAADGHAGETLEWKWQRGAGDVPQRIA